MVQLLLNESMKSKSPSSSSAANRIAPHHVTRGRMLSDSPSNLRMKSPTCALSSGSCWSIGTRSKQVPVSRPVPSEIRRLVLGSVSVSSTRKLNTKISNRRADASFQS